MKTYKWVKAANAWATIEEVENKKTKQTHKVVTGWSHSDPEG